MNNVYMVHDRKEAITIALNIVGEHDLILLAGKGHESEQLIGSERFAFNDATVVRSL